MVRRLEIQSTARDLLVAVLRRYLSDPAYADSLTILLHDEIVVQVPASKPTGPPHGLNEQ